MRFIRLTNIIINTSHIATVVHKNQSYTIHLANHRIDGVWILGNGFVNTENNAIVVCKTAHSDDYHIMEKWWTDSAYWK